PGYGGGQPPQRPRMSNGKIAGLALGALALVVRLVLGITRLVGPRGDPTPAVTPTGTETPGPHAPATAAPADPATGAPHAPPTAEPDDPATDGPDGPTGDAVEVAHGVSIVPADGWDEVERGDGYVVLYDGVSTFYGEAFFLPSSSGAADEAEAYLSWLAEDSTDRKSTRLNSSHVKISYAVFCLKKK